MTQPAVLQPDTPTPRVATPYGLPLPASRARRVLAVYVDLVSFSVPFAVAAWALGHPSYSLAMLLGYVVCFVIARVATLHWFGTSPGRFALGIGPSGVDPLIQRRETGWTLLAGALLVGSGSQKLTATLTGVPPEPLLGGASPGVELALLALLGAASMAAGFAVLRTIWQGAVLGAGALTAYLIGHLAHRAEFTAWAGEAYRIRRELAGLPPRAAPLEVSWLTPALLLVGAVALALVARHLRRALR